MKINFHIMMLFLILGTASCFSGKTNQTFAQLDANSFNENWQKQKNNAILIDVRTKEEYQGGHIESAVNIDFNNSSFDSEISKIDKNKSVFVYCLSGGRSASAVAILEKQGFKKVFELEGGMMAWRSASLPETTQKRSEINMNFSEFILNNEFVLIDFYAEWCAPCKKMKPILDDLNANNHVSVYPLNADVEQMLVSNYRVKNLPTLVLLKKSKEVWRGEGFHSKDQIIEIINRFK